MKIGIDARIVTSKNSGLVIYVKSLIMHLATRKNIELYLYCNTRYQEVFSFLKNNPNVHLRVVYFNNHFLHISNFIYEMVFFAKIINRDNLDLFHNPIGYGLPSGIKTRKILLTIHDVIPLYDYDELSILQKQIYKLSLGISIKFASKIVAISNFTKKEILQKYSNVDENKISVIYNGFENLSKTANLNLTFADLKRKLALRSKYILYIGSATKRKNLLNLTKAFIELKKMYHAPHQLVLVSKMDRKQTLKVYLKIKTYLEQASLEKEVIFAGYLEDREKAAMINCCDFFVFPSIYEGFGLPILEAMSFEKAVLCSNIPIFKEICEDSAYYFDPYDIDSICKSMVMLINDEQLKIKVGQAGKKRSKFFSWEKMADEYNKIYRNILKG